MSEDTNGTVVVSIDAELGWGHHDLPDPPAARVEYARTGWIRTLALLDEYRIPATWAVVGHLFRDDCDGRHADHPAPDGWFARERCAWRDRPDLRFGRGLVERVADAAVAHELGCHTFSHVLFDDPATTPELARAELDASARAAGRAFDSFVFPRNGVGHRDALADAGYACYRGPAPVEPFGAPGKLARALAASAPPIVRPRVDEHGLVNVPASLFLYGFDGAARALLEPALGDPIVRRVRAGLDRLAASDGVLHLWFHPNNVRNDRHARRLRGVLAAVAARRDAGDVTVETMGAVARRVRERSPGASAPSRA